MNNCYRKDYAGALLLCCSWCVCVYCRYLTEQQAYPYLRELSYSQPKDVAGQDRPVSFDLVAGTTQTTANLISTSSSGCVVVVPA